MTDIRAFLGGALAVFRGVAVVRKNPLLMRFVLYPLVLTVIGYVALVVAAWWWVPGWIEALLEWIGAPWGWLEWVVEILAVIVVVVAAVVSFVAVASLVAAPFNDPLSERIEQLLRGHAGDTPTGNWGIIRDVVRSVLQEARRLLVYLGLLVGGLCLLLIPVAGGVFFPVLMTYVSIRYLAWDGLDPCMSRRRMGFADKSAFLRRHRPATLGFGTMSFLLLLIPIVGALVIPFNVAGGTVLFCELLEREEETGDGEPPSPALDDHE